MRTDDKIFFKMDLPPEMGSPRFPSMQSTSELIDHAIEKGEDLMARSFAMAYESKTRLREHPDDPTDPYRRVNRIMDIADSRNRVVEQCGRLRDSIEMVRDHGTEITPSILHIWAQVLTEVLIDATGD